MQKKFPNIPPWLKWAIGTIGTTLASGGLAVGSKLNKLPFGIAWFILVIAVVLFVLWPRSAREDELTAAMEDFLAGMKFPEDADIRATLWLPDKNPEHLRQVINYLPAKAIGVGRTMYGNKGVVGQAYSLREIVIDFLPDRCLSNPKEFRKYHSQKWKFSKKEAEQLKADRRAYLAIPIFNKKEEVLGVIYCDAHKYETFANPDINQQIEVLVPLLRRLLD